MRDVVRHLPARLLTPDERALVAEWIAAAGDIASAYVSSRRSDDPAIYHRIAITASTGGEPSHYVQALAGRDIFMVIASGPGRRTNVKRFRTLRSALNSIRPVLGEAGSDEEHSKRGMV
jgi:hypothetical protein